MENDTWVSALIMCDAQLSTPNQHPPPNPPPPPSPKKYKYIN